MKLLRYAARSVSILNLLLAAVVVGMVVYELLPLMSVKVSYKARPSTTQAAPEAAAQPSVVPTPLDYVVVAEANLFHPDRIIPPEKAEEKQLPRPELVLYGTVVTGDLSYAYVEDKKAPFTTPGRGKRPQVLKKGDTIGGFVLKEIYPSRITLNRNEEVMTVNLDTAKERGGTPAAGAVQAPTPRNATIPSQRTLAPMGQPMGQQGVIVPQPGTPQPVTPSQANLQTLIPRSRGR